jgi:hypothetical protein
MLGFAHIKKHIAHFFFPCKHHLIIIKLTLPNNIYIYIYNCANEQAMYEHASAKAVAR